MTGFVFIIEKARNTRNARAYSWPDGFRMPQADVCDIDRRWEAEDYQATDVNQPTPFDPWTDSHV